ncbi:MAG: argininosuccinate lyase, partial [Muribaculaceae bacterium]|nr:argininosuccinate lyase [Muribaculaceae bacterium]
MAKKLWEKSTEVDSDVDRYTVGQDREMDLYLAEWDVIGSLAHITMLEKIGLLTADELAVLTENLREIHSEVLNPDFVIEPGIEDIHSQVELMLTNRLGDIGKKIHSGRSRNDQVLVDLKLMMRAKIEEVAEAVKRLFDILVSQSDK